MTITDRYGVADTYEFATNGGELYSDGVWNYENLGQFSIGLTTVPALSVECIPTRASRKRTRITTGEAESERFDSNNAMEVYKDVRLFKEICEKAKVLPPKLMS